MQELVSRVMLFLLVASVLALAFETRTARADGTVYINADGSITPANAPISTFDNVTYTLTGNVNESIVVERSNIVVDGAGYAVQGSGSGNGVDLESVNNVTVENASINDFYSGVWLNASSNDVLSDNSVTGNSPYGVYLYTSSNDMLTGNDVTGNYQGIVLDSCSNNTLHANNATGDPVVGIGLYSSSNNTLSGNDVIQSNALGGIGIYLSSSPYNALYGNNVTASYYGVGLDSSGECVLSQNVINSSIQSNFAVDGSSVTDFINWVDASNLVDGKPIYYIVNQNDLLIDPSTCPSVGFLVLANCTGIMVENLSLADIDYEDLLLAYTTNCTITQNNIVNNFYGIYIYSSSNNTLSSNNVKAANQYTMDGIILDSSFNNTVSHNNVTGNGGGIHVDSSSGNTVSGNNLTDNHGSIGLLGSSSNMLCNNMVTGSTSWGMWLDSSSNNIVSDNTVMQNDNQGIFSSYSFDDTFSGNNVTGNYGDGIYIEINSFNETVAGNNVTGNSWYGITIWTTWNNTTYGSGTWPVSPGGEQVADATGGNSWGNCTVSGNEVRGNAESGIALIRTAGNTISGNDVVGNGWGILLDHSSNGTIYHNNFVSNTQQAVISGSEPNTWDDGYPSGGNYWSDYNGTDVYCGPYQNVTGSDGIGDTPYVMDANNTDHYPLMNPYRPSSLSVAKTVVGQGFPLGVYFAGANYGDYPETLNITVYVNTTSIASQNVTLTGENSTITFTWNTTGFAYGNYTISAYAWPVQNETNTANNNFPGGMVYVGIPGDLNGDGTVDIYDAIILAGAFNSKPGSSNWNPNADINGDGTVDIYDAVILAGYFGQTADLVSTQYANTTTNIVYGQTTHFSFVAIR